MADKILIVALWLGLVEAYRRIRRLEKRECPRCGSKSRMKFNTKCMQSPIGTHSWHNE